MWKLRSWTTAGWESDFYLCLLNAACVRFLCMFHFVQVLKALWKIKVTNSTFSFFHIILILDFCHLPRLNKLYWHSLISPCRCCSWVIIINVGPGSTRWPVTLLWSRGLAPWTHKNQTPVTLTPPLLFYSTSAGFFHAAKLWHHNNVKGSIPSKVWPCALCFLHSMLALLLAE